MAAPPPPRRGLALSALRPNWLTAGLVRLGVLCGAIVAIGMLPFEMSPHGAGVVFAVGIAAVGAAGAAFLLATRRVAAHIDAGPLLGPAVRATLLILRRTGLPLVGLAFFLVWTFAYVGLWWFHPTGDQAAFEGLSQAPRFADFFYYAVSTALISPPGDIVAHSRGARSATMIEMLTGFALVTAYLSSFVDWQRTGDPDRRQ